jgi:hypothetical protein
MSRPRPGRQPNTRRICWSAMRPHGDGRAIPNNRSGVSRGAGREGRAGSADIGAGRGRGRVGRAVGTSGRTICWLLGREGVMTVQPARVSRERPEHDRPPRPDKPRCDGEQGRLPVLVPPSPPRCCRLSRRSEGPPFGADSARWGRDRRLARQVPSHARNGTRHGGVGGICAAICRRSANRANPPTSVFTDVDSMGG